MGALFLRMVIDSLKTVAEFLDWEKDPDHIVSEAACLFFFDLLSTHRDTETDKLINNAVAMVAPHISFIARRTRDAKSTHAHQLLKAAFLCSSCDDLHKFQTVLLANGTFLYHLHHVLKYSSSSDVHPNQEIVIATVAASEEARRTLGRIFPAPLLNVLDSASYFEKLSGVSYEDPLVEGHDNTIRDNMALCVVFRSLRTNWKDFWAKLDEQQTAYDFIWSQAMKAEVTESLQRELDDVTAREGTSGDAAWDYEGYRMTYPELEQFVCVDGYYLQQMIDAFERGEAIHIMKPVEFVHHLCDLFIVTRGLEEKKALLFLMSCVIDSQSDAAKNFPVMRYVCFLLEDEQLNEANQGLLLEMLTKLCKYQRNTEQIQDYHGLNSLSLLLARYLNRVLKEEPVAEASAKPVKEGLTCNAPDLSATQRIDLLVTIFNNVCDSMNRIRADLMSEPVLSRLLRVILLCPDSPCVSTIIHIISLSLSSATRVQSHVYLSGLFSILLLCSAKDEMSPEVAELLYNYHLLQEPSDVQSILEGSNEKLDLAAVLKEAGSDVEKQVELAKKYSFLRFFLPSSMIVLLTREGPEKFRAVFNSEETENSDVLWGREARAYLHECLHNQLCSYVSQIQQDYHADWKYAAPEAIWYEAIENKLVVYNVFLEAFLKPESEVPYTVDPVLFVNELIHALEQRLRVVTGSRRSDVSIPYTDIITILRSLLKVLQTKKEVSKLEKGSFAVLCRCLKVDLNVKANRVMADGALDVILEAMKPSSFGKPSTVSIYECAMAEGYVAFDWVLDKACDEELFALLSDPADTTVNSIVGKSLQCICLMATKSTPHALESLSTYPQFIHTLMNYIDMNAIPSNPEVSLAVLKALQLFLLDEKLLEICVNSGCLIYFLEISLCLRIENEMDHEIVNATVACLKILAGFDTEVPATTTVLNAMKQLLTPGLMKSLRNDTFINDLRAKDIRKPILIWNTEMANTLLKTLSDEDEKLYVARDQGEAFWNAVTFCHKDSYLHIYTNLMNEYIVDDVFLSPFLDQPGFDLQDPTEEHFLKVLMASIVQLESSPDMSFSDQQNKKRLLTRLFVYLKSLQQLLAYHSNLNTVFINDSNVRKLFVLLNDTTIGNDLQNVLLVLLQTAVSTQSGCDILASFVPDLCSILRSDCDRCYMPTLSILSQFIEKNDQVVHLIMSSSMVLILLDMVLFYSKSYDGNVQDMAVHLLGRMMKNKEYGGDVKEYLVALFTPLFKGKNEMESVLESCDEYPSQFLNVLASEIHDPNVYWDASVRTDLEKFLTNESHTLYTGETEYQYSASEVAKRMKSFRVTLNKQLVVADIFIMQYIGNPFCEINGPAFLAGLIQELSDRASHVMKKEGKEAEEYAALVLSLKLFLQSDSEQQEVSLYTKVVAFCIEALKRDVTTAQDSVLSILEFVVNREYGIKEFLRNNSTVDEPSYVTELLAISDILDYRKENSYHVTEILKVITKNPALREVVYHAGVLFYALDAILSNIVEIDSQQNTARCYMEIIKEIVTYIPEAEDDLLVMTTLLFKGQFQKEPTILNLFIRKYHEAFDTDSTVRVWNNESREALRAVLEQDVKRLNSECLKGERWNRVDNRCGLDEVKAMWKTHTKKNMNSERKFSQETTAIKLRQTTIGPRPNYVPTAPERPRTGSL